jgi:hypothetical protein
MWLYLMYEKCEIRILGKSRKKPNLLFVVKLKVYCFVLLCRSETSDFRVAR